MARLERPLKCHQTGSAAPALFYQQGIVRSLAGDAAAVGPRCSAAASRARSLVCVLVYTPYSFGCVGQAQGRAWVGVFHVCEEAGAGRAWRRVARGPGRFSLLKKEDTLGGS